MTTQREGIIYHLHWIFFFFLFRKKAGSCGKSVKSEYKSMSKKQDPDKKTGPDPSNAEFAKKRLSRSRRMPSTQNCLGRKEGKRFFSLGIRLSIGEASEERPNFFSSQRKENGGWKRLMAGDWRGERKEKSFWRE